MKKILLSLSLMIGVFSIAGGFSVSKAQAYYEYGSYEYNPNSYNYAYYNSNITSPVYLNYNSYLWSYTGLYSRIPQYYNIYYSYRPYGSTIIP